MAKRKKTPEPESQNTETSYSLSREELFKLQLAQLQARAAEAELQLEIQKKEDLLSQIDPGGRLQMLSKMAQGKASELAEAKKSYTETVKQIESRLSINLREWVFDDLTGNLSKMD